MCCGSHVGKKEKIGTSVSPKLLHRQKVECITCQVLHMGNMYDILMMSLVALLGHHNCMRRTLYPISLKIFFSVMAEQIEAKLYRCYHLSMRNKKFSTYDVIGHMVWQRSFFFEE